MSNIPFKCPSCRGGTFLANGDAEPGTYEQMVGATCQSCGRKVSDKDIKDFAVKIASDKLKKAFGKFK